jgi:hypothetical protein
MPQWQHSWAFPALQQSGKLQVHLVTADGVEGIGFVDAEATVGPRKASCHLHLQHTGQNDAVQRNKFSWILNPNLNSKEWL